MAGKIYPKNTLFFRVHVGEAKRGRKKYELSTNIRGACPIVLSKQTKQWFTLSWQELLDMAVAAGIDKELPKEKREG